MTRRDHRDAGQALPLYITVVGGLLFLAFAYFAVGQAAATRNTARTAADAAALAAAQEARDRLAGQWLDDLLNPESWQAVFDGHGPVGEPCGRAAQLASRNDARLQDCRPDGLLGYTVVVETNRPVGDTIVPGTESRRATDTATAVIEPRCSFDLAGTKGDEGDLPALTCKGEEWDLDPDDHSTLPGPQDLFDVHLSD